MSLLLSLLLHQVIRQNVALEVRAQSARRKQPFEV